MMMSAYFHVTSSRMTSSNYPSPTSATFEDQPQVILLSVGEDGTCRPLLSDDDLKDSDCGALQLFKIINKCHGGSPLVDPAVNIPLYSTSVSSAADLPTKALSIWIAPYDARIASVTAQHKQPNHHDFD